MSHSPESRFSMQETPRARVPSGRFGPADRIPPAWKLKAHFTGTKREVYGRLVQCRTGHAFIGEYYAKFVRDCEKYDEHRGVLREVSNQISIPDILGTEKGIQALAKFLESSGAFTKTGQPRRETEPLPPEDEEDDRESDAGSEGGYGGDEESGDEGGDED